MNKNRNLKYIYNVAGFAVIVFLAIREICGVVLAKIPFGEGSVLPILIGTIVFVTSCLVPTVTVENALGLHPKLFKKPDMKAAGPAVLYGYLLIIAASFANSIILTLLRLAGLEFAPRTLNFPQGFFAYLLYFIYVCILPPVLEEIFTRGYILNAFRGYGQNFAIIVSSLCFALLHSSLDSFLVYFCCGVILAQLYLTFDSLLPAMMLHCLNNSVSFFMTSFQTRANAQSALVLMVFIYVCVIIFGYAGKKHLNKMNIRFSDCFEKDAEILKKLFFCRKAYMAVAALCLLIFFAALGSYNSLVR